MEIAEGIQHVGFAAWQGCQQLQIVKLPSSVLSLEDGAFQGCYALREVVAPGCVQFSRRVFAERCSLSRIGVSQAANDWRQEHSWADVLSRAASRLHPSPLQWTKPTRQERCQKVHSVGRVSKPCLPSDFHNIGPRACENCKRLVEVNLMSTDITALPEHNAFLLCDNFEQPSWVELLPTEGPDSDAFDEDFFRIPLTFRHFIK